MIITRSQCFTWSGSRPRTDSFQSRPKSGHSIITSPSFCQRHTPARACFLFLSRARTTALLLFHIGPSRNNRPFRAGNPKRDTLDYSSTFLFARSTRASRRIRRAARSCTSLRLSRGAFHDDFFFSKKRDNGSIGRAGGSYIPMRGKNTRL